MNVLPEAEPARHVQSPAIYRCAFPSGTTLRWWTGAFCAFLGAFMVVAPDEFRGPAYAALIPAVPVWGVAFLLGGWGMLAVAAMRLRPWIHAAAHIIVGCVFALLAGGFAAVGGWSGTIVYGVLSLGIVMSSVMPTRLEPLGPERRRGDLFSFLIGIAELLLGLWLLVAGGDLDAAIYPGEGVRHGILGAFLLVVGALLAVIQVQPGLRRSYTRLVHVAAGLVLIVTVWFLAIPAQSWTGMVFYGSGGLLIALLPWLRYRLRHFDPGSLATRLALVLGAMTSLPLVLSLGALEAGHDNLRADHHHLHAFLLVLVAVSLAVGLGVVAARYLARPLRRLSEAADRLAAGEPAVPLQVAGVTELDRLSFNFRHMRDRLAARSREAEALAAELRARAEELGTADRRKDEFLAMLAHELRNPLGAIASASHLMEGLASDDPRVQRATRVIHRQMQHLTRLVDDLLDVSRITRGKVELKRTRLDLADLVRRSVEAAVPRLEAARLELSLDLPDDPVLLDADPTRLEQVLGNLLSNAIKYTEPGGRISLRVRTTDGSTGLREAVVLVADTGIGMPADLVPHIFDLFTQGERTLDRRAGGLGIGLTLVHQLVGMHGGEVRARSDGLGHGSEFEVRLPLAD